MKTFRIYWKDGLVQDLKGTDILDALKRAGYWSNAFLGIDHYDEIK